MTVRRGLWLSLLLSCGASCATPAVREPAAAPVLRRQTLLTAFTPTSTKVAVAFFDADSTLRVASSGQLTPVRVNDVFILPCVGPRLKQLAQEGFFIAIVSNQAEVGDGLLPIEVADGALLTTVQGIM